MRPATDPQPAARTTLGWAIYLACSWTWCIGMWLPMLLVRDHGLPGFVAFLVPNAIGAALVGWVLGKRLNRAPQPSFFASKRPLILAFTAVTVAFHGYWIMWMLTRGLETGAAHRATFIAGMIGGASIVGNAVAWGRRPGGFAAAVTLCCSLLAGIALVAAPPTLPDTASSPLNLAGLALVCALGFGLCPYLDITFNHAAHTSRRPRTAFTVGFVLFAVVLLLVTPGRGLWRPLLGTFHPQIPLAAVFAAIGAHMGAQATFTLAASMHAFTATTTDRVRSFTGMWLLVIPFVVGLLLAVPAVIFAGGIASMGWAEIGYRAFLGAYGLVFPAWLILTIGNRPPTSRRTLLSLAGVCVVAVPFFVVGFIWLKEVWLIPGVAIVLAGRLLADPTRVPVEPFRDRLSGPTDQAHAAPSV